MIDSKHLSLVTAELENLANGSAQSGDPLAAKICRDGIAEIKRLQREKAARAYYQDIVYSVCTILDAIEGRDITKGQGIVCGTFDMPETEVQEAMVRLDEDRERLQSKLRRVRDWLKFAANSPGGIVSEIDDSTTRKEDHETELPTTQSDRRRDDPAG